MGTRKQHRNIEVMGLMQWKTDGDAIIVMDAFVLPVEGTKTRVNAQADAYEYMVDYSQTNKQTPCGHNFCLKCFQRWVGLGKHTCANCRHATPAKMASNPRINSSLVTAIRMAKMSKANGFVGPPKVHHFAHNQNRPDKAYTTDRAKKSGKANACSGKIFVTVPPDHFGPIQAENVPDRKHGILVGETWVDLLECRQWGVHLPHVVGISGQPDYGAHSVALSGGYEDDEDHGE